MLPLKTPLGGKARSPVPIKSNYESSQIKETLTIIGNWLIGRDLGNSEAHLLHRDESSYNNGVALTYFDIDY
jgi:hypothetical protein